VDIDEKTPPGSTVKRFLVVGNPNTGKTSLFNVLTNSLNQTGNWSGVTTTADQAVIPNSALPDINFVVELVDTPGIYSLVPDVVPSLDQREVCDLIAQDEYDGIINLVDGLNVERNLYLTLQLLQLKKPMIVCINFADIADVDERWPNAIKKMLNVPVVVVSSHSGLGIEAIRSWLSDGCSHCDCMGLSLSLEIDTLFERVVHTLQLSRLEAMRVFESSHGNDSATIELQDHIKDVLGQPGGLVMMSARLALIKRIKTGIPDSRPIHHIQSLLDKAAFHPFFGPLIFLVMMFAMFTFSIIVGGVLQDPLEILVSGLLVNGVGYALKSIGAHPWLIFLLSDGIGGGIATVAAFIPVVWALFIFLSCVEESGYIARAAVMVDNILKKIGLPGSAFIPLIVGFGCNVPAIAAVKNLDSFGVRVKIAMMMPFMSCSARLTVYAVFCSAFFKEMAVVVIFVLYLLGVFAAIFTGWLIDKVGGFHSTRGLIIELPVYRIPSWRRVCARSYSRVASFVSGAGKTIVMVFVIVQVTGAMLQHLDLQEVQWATVKKWSVVPFKPMGITEKEWPLVAGLAAGVVAKEVTVGTLSAIYSHAALDGSTSDTFSFSDVLNSAWEELRSGVFNSHDTLLSTENNSSLAKMLSTSIDDKVAIMAYLIFVLLYFPCISVYAVTKQEVGTKWAILSAAWSTILAYVCAVGFYQFVQVALLLF
jgi:ferrous iron transport protein B